jgi:hypothetical protein
MIMTDTNPFGAGVIRRQITPPEGSKAGLLVVPATIPSQELQIHCQAFRDSTIDHPGAHEVLFEETLEDGSTDDDAWLSVPYVYGQSSAGRISQADKWRRIMDWPEGRPPTFAEAQEWQMAVGAEAQAALVDRIMAFRERYQECEALAERGGLAFWRGKVSLPPERRDQTLSIPDVVNYLTEASPATVATWAAELDKAEAATKG